MNSSPNEIPDHLWTSEETAQFLGIPKATLYQLNYKGTGPTFYKVGKYRRFMPSEVMAWVNVHKVKGVAY